jgi:GNAT superfamily N-acetyltransferase
MDLSVDKRMENNEAGFCSLWTDHFRINDCADLFVNNKFNGDYFFNRLNPFVCSDTTVVIEKAIGVCLREGTDCYVHVHDQNTKDQYSLLEAGFRWIDTMQILRATSNQVDYDIDKIRVVRVSLRSIPDWVETFCESFGVLAWEPEVKKIIDLHFRKLILLLSYIHVGKSSAKQGGCAALFANHGVLGLYCLGTITHFRGLGLAKKMISISLQIAQQLRIDSLFLQTFTSEGLLPFYEKLGFRLLYKKRVYALKRNSFRVLLAGDSLSKH